MTEVFAFEVWIRGERNHSTVINARTLGKAKSEYLRDINDVCDFKYTDIAGCKIGEVQTSERFISNAKYRGVPDVRCGQRIEVSGGGRGVIVGHNSSANFDVLFDDNSPMYPGLKLNVHPGDVAYV